MKWNRPKFCTASGPGGPEEIKPRNRILRAGTFAEEYRDNPRKRGSGGGSAGAVRRPRDTPGGVLPPLPPRAKEVAPQGETLRMERNPSEKQRADLRPAPTTSQADHRKTGQREGQAPPLQGGWGDIPWRRTGGRLSELFSLTINFAPQGEPLHPKIRMEGFPVFYISIVTGA